MPTPKTPIVPAPPAGLVVHCSKCNLVVPADAPRVEGADCEFIAKHKLAWFNPKETPAAQHVMAVAAWALIHDSVLKSGEASAATYHAAFRKSRKDHFSASAVRKAMSSDQVQAGRAHKRDGALFK